MGLYQSGTIFNQDSVDVDFRVESNDNASMLFVDGGNNAVGIGTTPSGSEILHVLDSAVGTMAKFECTESGAVHGPTIEFQRDSSSPADNDLIGRLNFTGNDSGGNTTVYTQISNLIRDVTDGTEDGLMEFGTIVAGTLQSRLELDSTEAVFNEGSIDIDFRVESDTKTHAFFVDAARGEVAIGALPIAQFAHCILQVGNQATLGANASLSTSGQTYLTHNLYFNTDGLYRVFNTSGANEGTVYSQFDGQHVWSVSAATTGNPTVVEKMRVNTTGLGVGTNDPICKGDFNSAASVQAGRFHRNTDGTTRTVISFRSSSNTNTVGTISITDNATAYNTSSDYRLKENVDYDWDATTRLKKLKPARFNWISDDTNTLVDGFLAHEAAEAVPESVQGTKDETEDLENVVFRADGKVLVWNKTEEEWELGKRTKDSNGNSIEPDYPSDSTWAATHTAPVMQSIDQAKLVPLLVKTIQELEARITALNHKLS
tara:strand:- start:260 stop:1720 length:1461 start_codon:yes stop_codon:yes gene_type:complete